MYRFIFFGSFNLIYLGSHFPKTEGRNKRMLRKVGMFLSILMWLKAVAISDTLFRNTKNNYRLIVDGMSYSVLSKQGRGEIGYVFASPEDGGSVEIVRFCILFLSAIILFFLYKFHWCFDSYIRDFVAQACLGFYRI